MLAHELAHLAGNDPAWYLLADILAAALWWHPLIWWSRRQLHAQSELAADEASLLERAGIGVWLVPGSARNFKITQPGDLELAEFYMAQGQKA